MQETKETNRFTAFEQRAKPQPDFPFDLNDLCNFQYSFDVLKKAIEYLSRQQRDQQTLLADLIESMKTRGPAATTEVVRVVETPAPRQEKELAATIDAPPQQVVVEKALPGKDWGPLMNDYDRRIEAMEKKIADQKPITDSRKLPFPRLSFYFAHSLAAVERPR